MQSQGVQNKKTQKRTIDWILLSCVVFLVLFGLMMIFSASSYTAKLRYGDSFHFVKKQAVGAVIGLVCMVVLIFFDHNKIQKFAYPALGFGLLLLILVFVPGLGVSNYGAKRWLNLGVATIQSSEIAKITFILFAAYYMSKYHENIRKWWGFLPVVAAGGVTCLLIILEPNMSITVCVGLTMIAMLFVGGVKFKHLICLIIPIFVLIPILIFIEPYRLSRLSAFLNPWESPQGEGYQLIQSLYALGSGGWFGLGLFNSRQKYLFLPFAESDFIFGIIGEELGFVGAIGILLVFFILILRAIKISINAKTRFGCYLSAGIAAMIAIQVLVNVAVVSGAIPPTGLPLPFVSAGGSSLVVMLCAVGILLNISRTSHKKTVPAIE